MLNAQKLTAVQENIGLFGLLRFKTHRLVPIGCINKVTTEPLDRSAEGYSHQRDFGLLSELFFSSDPVYNLHTDDNLLILHMPSRQVTFRLIKASLSLSFFSPFVNRMDFLIFFSLTGEEWERSDTGHSRSFKCERLRLIMTDKCEPAQTGPSSLLFTQRGHTPLS